MLKACLSYKYEVKMHIDLIQLTNWRGTSKMARPVKEHSRKRDLQSQFFKGLLK